MSIRTCGAALAALGLALACGKLGEVFTLQRGLAQEFKTPAVSVSLNNGTQLNILFNNSPMASLPDSERAEFARHVGQYVRDHFRGYSTLESISVGFSEASSVGIVNVRSTRVPFSFTPSDLGPPRDSTHATPTQ